MQTKAFVTKYRALSNSPILRTMRMVRTRFHLFVWIVALFSGLSGCGTLQVRSPDGTRTVTLKGILYKVSVVENGKVLSKHDGVLRVVFSHDSKHLAYAVKEVGLLQAEKSQVIVDGRPQHTYEKVAGCSLAFSSDNQHVAYVASEKGRSWFIVADGVAQSSLSFSGDLMPDAFRSFGRAFGHPPDGPAVLVCDFPMFLDGHDGAPSTFRRRLSSLADELEVKPGRHTVKVHYSGVIGGSSATTDSVELQWDAKAGHVYLVNGSFDQTDQEGFLASALNPENIVNAIFGTFTRIGGRIRFVIVDMTELLSRSIKYPTAHP